MLKSINCESNINEKLTKFKIILLSSNKVHSKEKEICKLQILKKANRLAKMVNVSIYCNIDFNVKLLFLSDLKIILICKTIKSYVLFMGCLEVSDEHSCLLPKM
ncbi:hypothetical protein Bhyg_01982, partial [Pseudolycoriella hygida]